MTYFFSDKSAGILATCDPRIQRVMKEVIKEFDFSVIEGTRDEETQNRYYDEGKSQLKWPESNHNTFPSKAVDIWPYPVDWNDELSFYKLAVLVLEEASKQGVKMAWGGSWTHFKDMPHFELVED